jgi:hypothetical protein
LQRQELEHRQAQGRSSMGPPKSPGDARRRRRSSVGSSKGNRTPLAAIAINTGNNKHAKLTPLAAKSAPRLRRSSCGAPLSRTPAEAVKAAMQEGGGGLP